MAVDTAVKRHSALHVLVPSVPLPDGTVGAGDRQTLARLYSGILAGEPVAAAVEFQYAATQQRRRERVQRGKPAVLRLYLITYGEGRLIAPARTVSFAVRTGAEPGRASGPGAATELRSLRPARVCRTSEVRARLFVDTPPPEFQRMMLEIDSPDVLMLAERVAELEALRVRDRDDLEATQVLMLAR